MRGTLLMVLLLGGSAALADEVKLKNGDRISGTVKSLASGKLAVATPHAGVLSIDWAQVESVTTDAKVSVTVTTGETFEGRLSAGANRTLKIRTEGAAEPIEMDFAKVKAFNQTPNLWRGNVNLSARATDGNTHTRNGLASVSVQRTTETDDFIIRGIYRYGTRSGELQERNAYGMTKYNHQIAGDFSGYVSAEFLSDTFKDLRLQSIFSAGFGYQLVRTSWMDLGVEAGLAYIDNNYRKIQEDSDHFGARASVALRVDLFWGFQFKDLFTIYPNFDESQDFQIRNEATLTNNLGAGWSLIAGVITEWDREPAPGRARHDNTYFLGLGYSF
jgi:putative salt-induced outer membrane protein YdiY